MRQDKRMFSVDLLEFQEGMNCQDRRQQGERQLIPAVSSRARRIGYHQEQQVDDCSVPSQRVGKRFSPCRGRLMSFRCDFFSSETRTFAGVELEEVTDDDDDDKRASASTACPSTPANDDRTDVLLERLATHLVESILSEILVSNDLDVDDNDDNTNVGVRELSDDENGLRELDENDMSGTDEFIVFATKAQRSDNDDDDDGDAGDGNDTGVDATNDKQISMLPRGSLNRLYTFSRTNDDGSSSSRKASYDQVCTHNE